MHAIRLLWISCRITHGREVALSLEQWYMLFSLLSAATSGSTGRPYVWEALSYLLHHNLINDINFTPCRNLLLRFIHG